MNEPRRIWLAISDGGQPWPHAAFTSQELARESSDEVMELFLFDRSVRTEPKWNRWVEVREGVAWDYFAPSVSEEWPEWLDSYGQTISRADTHHYNANPYNGDGEHTWIIVEGNDPQAVNAEVDRRLQELGATWTGQRPSKTSPELMLLEAGSLLNG